jgi:hypothetical protein
MSVASEASSQWWRWPITKAVGQPRGVSIRLLGWLNAAPSLVRPGPTVRWWVAADLFLEVEGLLPRTQCAYAPRISPANGRELEWDEIVTS